MFLVIIVITIIRIKRQFLRRRNTESSSRVPVSEMNVKEKVSFQLGLETLQRIRHVISQLVEQTRTVMA